MKKILPWLIPVLLLAALASAQTAVNMTRVAGRPLIPDVVHGVAVAAGTTPVPIGATCETSISGATMVSDTYRTNLYAGCDGVLIVRPWAPLEDLVQERVTNTDGASTAFASGLAAAGSGIRLYLTDCTISNTDADNGGTLDLRDGSGGAVVWTIPVPMAAASDPAGVVHPFTTPLKFSANTAVAYDMSAVTSTVTIACKGFKSKLG